jgi:predicted regulator of Ras-like GTPase activity (Roadblock/LC7/MglB family)
MFGFLKKLGKKSEPVAPLIPVATPPSHSSSAAVAEPVYAPAATVRPAVRSTVMPRQVTPMTPRVRPVPARVAPTLRQAPVAETPVYEFPSEAVEEAPIFTQAPPADELVALPLKKLWNRLNPAVIQGAAHHPNGDASLQLPLSLLRDKLAKGAVRMPFTEFTNYISEGLFAPNTEKDGMEVDIPVAAILPLLKPEYISRRPNQKKTAVPDDIAPIFGPDGSPAPGLRIADSKRPAAAPAATAKAAPSPAPIQAKVPASPISAPVAPIAMREAAPVVDEVVVPPPAPIRNEPIPAPKLDPSLATLKPKSSQGNGVAPSAPKAAPAIKAPSLSAPINRAPVPPTPIPVPVAPAPVAPASTVASNNTASGAETLNIAAMDLAAFWSEKGKTELSNLYRHTLEIPMSTLESGLKAGRLVFQWREVRPWLRLAPGNSMPSLQDEFQIELPLAIIAPRFLEQRVHGKSKPRFELKDDIGDVFEQKTPAPAPATAPSAPMLGAVAVPMDLATSQTASSKTGDTAFISASAGKPLLEFGEIFGQPEKKHWTLAEVTQKTTSLRGVAGAVLGSMDGLLVAGTWPNDVKGDAVAAFLPQIFSRLLHFTKELKLDEPNNVTLMIGNVPLQIFKAGTSFFTVIGRAGENLPKAQLNAIATRLGTNFSGK